MFDLENIKIWLGIAGFILLLVLMSDVRSCTDRLMGRPEPLPPAIEKADRQRQEPVRVAQDVVKEALIKEAKSSGKPQSKEIGNLVITAYPDGSTSSVPAHNSSSIPAQKESMDWKDLIYSLGIMLVIIVVIRFIAYPVLQSFLIRDKS